MQHPSGCPYCRAACAVGPYGPRLTCGGAACEVALTERKIAPGPQTGPYTAKEAKGLDWYNQPLANSKGEVYLTPRMRAYAGR